MPHAHDQERSGENTIYLEIITPEPREAQFIVLKTDLRVPLQARTGKMVTHIPLLHTNLNSPFLSLPTFRLVKKYFRYMSHVRKKTHPFSRQPSAVATQRHKYNHKSEK